MCGHSLEVNVTSSLDFYLSVAQVQLLQQLLRDNMVGVQTPESGAEVHVIQHYVHIHYEFRGSQTCLSNFTIQLCNCVQNYIILQP